MALGYITWLYLRTLGIHLQVSVQLSLVVLLVIPLVPGEYILLFPAQYNGMIQQRSWEQTHSSVATSSLNSFKNQVSPNYMLTTTVLVTSQILFCLLCQMQMNWHASMRRDRRALLGKAWGACTFVYHMGMQMPSKAQRRRMSGEVSIRNQAVPFSPWRRSAGRMPPGSLGSTVPCDQKGAFFTRADLQGLAEVLALWPEMG